MQKLVIFVGTAVLAVALLVSLSIIYVQKSTETANRELLAAARELAKNPPESQRAALSDGTITRNEYVQAVHNERECVLAWGYDAEQPTWDNDQYHFSTTATYAQSEDSAAADALFLQRMEDCRNEHVHPIATIWALQDDFL